MGFVGPNAGSHGAQWSQWGEGAGYEVGPLGPKYGIPSGSISANIPDDRLDLWILSIDSARQLIPIHEFS